MTKGTQFTPNQLPVLGRCCILRLQCFDHIEPKLLRRLVTAALWGGLCCDYAVTQLAFPSMLIVASSLAPPRNRGSMLIGAGGCWCPRKNTEKDMCLKSQYQERTSQSRGTHRFYVGCRWVTMVFMKRWRCQPGVFSRCD